MAGMSIADKLGTDKFTVDESRSHILIDKNCADRKEIDKLLKVCPAGLYQFDGETLRFDYLGCLECGSCRVMSGGRAITSWSYPDGPYGVTFRQG